MTPETPPAAPKPGTLTTVRAILFYRSNLTHVWVGEFTEDDYKKGQRGFPGGKAERGEPLFPAMLRELEEEAGLSADKLEILMIPPVQRHHIYGKSYCYLVALHEDASPASSGEITHWQHLSLAQILADPLLIDFCRDYLTAWQQRPDSPLQFSSTPEKVDEAT